MFANGRHSSAPNGRGTLAAARTLGASGLRLGGPLVGLLSKGQPAGKQQQQQQVRVHSRSTRASSNGRHTTSAGVVSAR
ncbi:Hypothetical predicted protein [Olea europaea subsp. europaea]|uniref:Uncharacterized protein n=1 Tax=Olea europaea subsp. europaea TaxID=158383 RepID=A0A8S0TM73_OLEEU|nr:Hypothetical predicted protein [Olea europaea subsp. europaea]